MIIPDVTQELYQLITYYDRFFGKDKPAIRECVCDIALYPEVVRGPNQERIVCEAHRWLDLRERAMTYLTNAGYARPLARDSMLQILCQSEHRALSILANEISELQKTLENNPLDIETTIHGFSVERPIKVGLILTHTLSTNFDEDEHYHTGEHFPVLLTSKMLADFEFSRDDLLSRTAKQLLLYSPVLIIIDSKDGRIPFSNLVESIYSRQYGIAIIIEELI